MVFMSFTPWFFKLTYMMLQNNCINNGVTNDSIEKKEKKACKTALYGKTRKATGFKSLGD